MDISFEADNEKSKKGFISLPYSGRSKGDVPGARPPPPPAKKSQFHAVFLEILTKSDVGAPYWRLGAPLTGNPGSAPALILLTTLNILYKSLCSFWGENKDINHNGNMSVNHIYIEYLSQIFANFRAVTSKRFCRLLFDPGTDDSITYSFCSTRNWLVIQRCNEAAHNLHGGSLSV